MSCRFGLARTLSCQSCVHACTEHCDHIIIMIIIMIIINNMIIIIIIIIIIMMFLEHSTSLDALTALAIKLSTS